MVVQSSSQRSGLLIVVYIDSPHVALNPLYGMRLILFISFMCHPESMMGRPGASGMKMALG